MTSQSQYWTEGTKSSIKAPAPVKDLELVEDLGYQGKIYRNPADGRYYKYFPGAAMTGSRWDLVESPEDIAVFDENMRTAVDYAPALADKSKSVRFPEDIGTHSDSDFVLFEFYDYKPPFQNRTTGAGLTGGLKSINQTLEDYNKTGYSNQYFKDSKYPQILLYMPDDIQDAFKADWEGKGFGSTTAGVLASAGREGNLKKLEESLKAASGVIDRLKVNAAASIVTNLASGITGDTISTSDVFGSISGVVRNPNVEVLFQKMNLRTFDLRFKMAPFTVDDAKAIKRIVETFKQAMLPQYALGDAKVFGFTGGSSNAGLEAGFIKVPKVCAVNYMKGSEQHPFLPKYKMCAITDVQVNYTPDNNYATLSGGVPVATELKVSFMETKLVFSEDVEVRGF